MQRKQFSLDGQILPTLISFLEESKEDSNNGITFIYSKDKELFLSYKDLYLEAAKVLQYMQEGGVATGAELILAINDNRKFLVFFWACLLGKIIPVPLHPGNQDEHMNKVISAWKTLSDPHLACEQTYLSRLKEYPGLKEGDTKDPADGYIDINSPVGLPGKASFAAIGPEDLAYIQFSSGSTGEAKGVRLTHRNLSANILDILSRSETSAQDRVLSWMPLSHDMGLICFHLSAVAAGCSQYIMDTPLFIRNPIQWIEKASQHSITQLYSPNFGYHYFLSALENHTAEGWDLSHIRIIYNGAEPISYELCQRFLTRLAVYGLKPLTMFPGYGMAEASVAVALPHVNDPLKVYSLSKVYLGIGDKIRAGAGEESVSFVENGFPLEHCSIRICGPKDEIYEEGTVGNIQIKGDNVTNGYYNNEKATKNIFTRDGWLKTGDIGFLYGKRLVVTGRSKNIIIINGQNYYPQDIERMISSFIKPFDLGKVVACGAKSEKHQNEQLLVFLLYKGAKTEFVKYARSVREILLEKMGLPVHAVIPIPKIPKTTSGKIQHFKLATSYSRGEYDSICEKIDQLLAEEAVIQLPELLSLEDKLSLIWEKALGKKPIRPDTEFFAAGLTSLVAIQLAGYVRQLLGINLRINDLFLYPTISRLAAHIRGRRPVPHEYVTPVEAQDYYVVTPIQARFWLLSRLEDRSTTYNLSSACLMEGNLNRQALAKSFEMLVGRYEIIRTTFIDYQGCLRQRVRENCEEYGLRYIDLRNDPQANLQVSLLAQKEASLPFDLETGPLMRCTLFHVEDAKYLFVFSIHHIIADGWSIDRIIRYIQSAYREIIKGSIPLKPLPKIQYRDYAVFCSDALLSPQMEEHRNYWKKELEGELTPVEFAFARPRKTVQTFAGNSLRYEFSAEVNSELEGFSSRYAVTPFMVLMAALRAVVHRYTGQADIIIGTDTAGRTQPGLEEQIGCFLNTLPLRVQIDPDETFVSLLKKERIKITEALEHQDYSFDRMVDDLYGRKEFSRAPLFDILVVFQNMGSSFGFEDLDNEIRISPIELPAVSTMVDIEFEFFIDQSVLYFKLHYNTDLFELSQMERMAAHLNRFLEQAIKSPEARLFTFDIMPESEKRQLEQFSQGVVADLSHENIIDWFESKVPEWSDFTALVCGDRRLNYSELNDAANRLAHYLLKIRSIGSGSRIGLMTTRSEQMVIGMLAILKAGSTYVPVDPDYPMERIRYIIEDAGIELLITDAPSLGYHPDLPCSVLVPENVATEISSQAGNNPVVADRNGTPPCILYTSGSSGQPKGVILTQTGICDYIQTFITHFGLTRQDGVIQQSSLSFDISIEEIFSTLCSGARLLILKEGGRNIEDLLKTIEKEKATILSTTPPVINEINQQADRMSSLRVLISGGDSLKPSYIDWLIHKVDIYNTYGPTETTVCVTYHKIRSADQTSIIGKPLPNHRIYILDDQEKLLPMGVAGHLCISGPGLARGYTNTREEAGAFTAHPFIEGARLYKTGDMAFWQEDGQLKFLGRRDSQFKWRGYRMEPAEIEKQILRFGEIKDVLVRIAGKNNRQKLVAYLSCDPSLDTEDLKMFLGQYLPSYMVPSGFVILPQFPVTANGKIDIRALPDPGENEKAGSEPPVGEAENAVCEIWKDILQYEKLGVTDNFFELGGTSLSATRIISRMEELFRRRFSLRDLLTYPTVRGITRFLASSGQSAYADIPVTAHREYYPLSLSQRRLWVLHQLERENISYNLCWTFIIRGKQADRHFEQAIDTLVRRHEMLRAGIQRIKGEPFLRIMDPGPGSLPLLRINEGVASDPLLWKNLIVEQARTPFDLEKAPLFKIITGAAASDEYRIGFIIHHIITDGWSMEVFWNELSGLMNAYQQNIDLEQVPLKIAYKDYTAWQYDLLSSAEMTAHAAYWNKRFEGEIPIMEFPAVRPVSEPAGPMQAGKKGKILCFPVSDELREGLQTLAKANEVTLFTVYLAVVETLLFKYTGQRNMIIASPVANRNYKELENQIGYYLNILPLFTPVDPEHSFEELLDHTKLTVLEAFEHQEYPVEKLIEKLGFQGDLARHPLFDIMLVWQNFDKGKRSNSPLNDRSNLYEIEEIDNETYVCSLLLEFNEFKNYQVLKIRYDAGQFEEEQIRLLAASFASVAGQVLQDGKCPLHQYSLLPDAERNKWKDWSRPSPAAPPDYEHFLAAFEKHVRTRPHQTALVFGDAHFTYKEIDRIAGCLAERIRRTGRSGPGNLVGVLVQRSERLILSILAVLKSGSAYVPLDTDYPPARIEFMIRNCSAAALITEKDCLQDIDPGDALVIDWGDMQEWVSPDRNLAQVHDSDRLDSDSLLRKQDLAYVMYTSGSTGDPKGVMISHSSLVDYLQTFTTYYSLVPDDRVVQQSSPAFDVSVEEIFSAYYAGATLLMLPEGGRNIERLCRLLVEERATLLSTTPMVIAELNVRPLSVSNLRVLISGGDRLKASHIDKIIGRVNIYNTYGPTEITVCAAYHPVTGLTDAGLIGRPIANHSIYILDDYGNPVPAYIAGEMYISGPGVAQGYLNLPGETEKRFIKDPFRENERMFRSGDIAMWHSDGNIQFIGRKDNQVKIKGFRVEVAEVEKALLSFTGIQEALVIVENYAGTDNVLKAFFLADHPIAIQFLRSSLLSRLPYYMIPSQLIQLEAFPITLNGKIDYASLSSVAASAGFESPVTEMEQEIAQLWTTILEKDKIGRSDNFFSLGGNSIKATQLISRLQEQFDRSIHLRDIFTYPILQDLARRMNDPEKPVTYRIQPIADSPYYDVSNAQKRIWVLTQLEKEQTAYHIFMAYRINGMLDRELLEQCFAILMERHESLRTTFGIIDGQLKQIIHAGLLLPLRMDFKMLEREEDADEALRAEARSEQDKPFDLTKGPLFRIKLVRISEDQFALFLTLHHIISDGWSVSVLFNELNVLYSARQAGQPPSLPALPIQYRDYAHSMNELIASDALLVHQQYWLQTFGVNVPRLELPTDFPRPKIKTYRGGTERLMLDGRLFSRLAEMEGREEVTLFMILLTALNALLYRYTGQDDIVIGTPISGREFGNLEDQIGVYVNSLPLRTVFSNKDSFRELLQRVKKCVLDGFEHQLFPFDHLIGQLGMERDLSRSPLFDVMLAMQQAPGNRTFAHAAKSLTVEPIVTESLSSKFDLTLYVFEAGAGLELVLEYSSDLFTKDRASLILQHYRNMLEQAVIYPDGEIGRAEILTSFEKSCFKQFNARYHNAPVYDSSVIELIDEAAKEMPEKRAVICGDRSLNYKELIEKANAFANYLIDVQGVKPNDMIGLMTARSESMIIALLGILKAGAGYVPIDPGYPEIRIGFLVADSAVNVVVTEKKFRHYFKDTVSCIFLDNLAELPSSGKRHHPDSKRNPDDIAYIIYTSGSTGWPKGIPITHKNLFSLIAWAKQEFKDDPVDIIYASTSYCFDLSVFEMLFPLSTGKCVRVLDSGLQISNFLSVDRNILINTVPGIVEILVNMNADFSNTRSVNMAGESVYPGLKQKLDVSRIKFRNLYGPSEDTTYSTCYLFKEEDSMILIGKPVDKSLIYILDENRNQSPVGVNGEICISGNGLAGGYLNQPELTAEKFVDSPLQKGEKLYLTGDLGRWLMDGNLEFLGRKDDQVKIRGYRLEPGEIEKIFAQLKEIKKVLVLAIGTKSMDKQLVAYYTVNSEISKEKISGHLEKYLPGYMIPWNMLQIDAFPLTPNGKIDRKSLQKFDWPDTLREYMPPRTNIEKLVAGIWSEVLGKDKIGMDDNFFVIGGHSLTATMTIARVNSTFNIQLELKDIFVCPTIEKLAQIISEKDPAGKADILAIEEQDYYEPSHMQRRLWILSQLEKDQAAYNMSSLYRIEGNLKLDVLEKVYGRLMARHENLRSYFTVAGGRPKLKIQNPDAPGRVVERIDLRNAGLSEAAALQMASEMAGRPFDLKHGPLISLKLLQLGDNLYLFLVNMHHIISDGWSMNVIMKEILQDYRQLDSGTAQTRPLLPFQYKDFAAWQNRQLKTGWLDIQRDFWHNALQGEIYPLDLPCVNPRPPVKTYNGESATVDLGSNLQKELTQLANRYQATLHMTLVASFNALLYRYTEREDILIGIPAAGRGLTELETQIGLYTNTLAIRTILEGTKSFAGLLTDTREVILSALVHQYYPFDKLVDELNLKRDLARSPLFDIMIVFQDGLTQEKTVVPLNDISLEEKAPTETAAKFDLTLTFYTSADQFKLTVEYNRDIYSSQRVRQLISHFRQVMASVIGNPAVPLSEIDYLQDAERHTLLAYNSPVTPTPFPARDNNLSCIVRLFEQKASETPLAKAVIYGDKILSYQELNQSANKIARLLRTEHQIRPNELVGLIIDRSERLIIAILGILKAGAAYVPIDPAYPSSRKEYIIRHSRLKVAVTEKKYGPVLEGCKCIFIEDEEVGRQSTENLPLIHQPSDLAYVLYTSGTTGIPKGVMVEHHSVVNLSDWLRHILYSRHSFPLTVMMNASVSFDSSVKQLFPPLLAGSSIVLVSEQTHKDPKALVAALIHHRVDVCDITPGYLVHILKYVDKHKPFPAYILAGGEPLSPSLANHYNELLQDRSTLINVYGVTEATVDSTYCLTNEQRYSFCNIGRPLPNTGIYILDKDRRQVPVGYPGQICIAGEGVARGYLYDEEQTTARFIDNPYGEGRLYCTGDIGLYHAGGEIEFIGRADRQVKVSGYRIELGEVEQAVLGFAGVQQALAVTLQSQHGETQIAVYYTGENVPLPDVMRHYLEAKIPSYSLPGWLVPLQELPRNEHGKINKDALPDPRSMNISSRIREEEPMGDETERRLAGIWEEVLECRNIGRHDNFFELGGNSLKLIRLYDSIQEVYPDKLEIHQLFSNPTISKLSGLLRSHVPGNEVNSPRNINLIEF